MADVNFTIDLRATQKTIIVEDNLTYGLSWPIAGTVAVITISGPKGVIYANTDFNLPDIVPATSKFLNKTIELPLDPQTNYTNILKGNYTLKVTWYNPILDQEYEFLKTYQYNFDDIEITNTTVSGPYSGTLISEDTTEYGDHVYSLAREHRVIYPTQLDPLVPDIVSSDEVVMVNPIYTNQWAIQITTEIEYRNADELRLLWDGYGEFTHYVYGSCIDAMADVIDIMLTRYYTTIASQSYNQEAYQKRLTIVNTAWQLLTLAYYQGNVEEADKQSYVIQEQVKYSGATLPGSTASILVVPCPPWEGGVFPEGTYVFENGLTKTLDLVPHVKLGGSLIETTNIVAGTYGFNITGASEGWSFSSLIDAENGIRYRSSDGITEGRVFIEPSLLTLSVANLSTPSLSRSYELSSGGLVEASDYKAGYSNRSLIAKDYVDINFISNADGSFFTDYGQKTTPIGADRILIENSEDGYRKISATISSLGIGVNTFIELTDAFNTYTGNADKAVIVNSGEDALIAYDLTQTYIHKSTSNQFASLATKTPVAGDYIIIEDSQDSYSKKKSLVGSITGSGVTAFRGLTDVPNSYAGFGGYFVMVKSDTTGLEFVTGGGWVPSTGGTYTGRVYFSTTNVNSIVAKRSNVVGSPGTPTAAENYVEFQDGDGDVQGRVGIDSSGNIYLTTNVGGGKVYLNKNTYVNGDITLSGLVDTVDIAAFKSAYDIHTHTFASITSKPTTLAGYGITDAVTTIDGDFDVQFSLKTTGISTDRLLIEDSEDSYAKKYITIDSIVPDLVDLNYWTKTGSDVSYTAGTVTVQTLDGIIIGTSGVLSAIAAVPVDQGGTGIASYGTSNQMLGMNNTASILEYKTFTGTNITIDHHIGEIEFIIPQDIAVTASPTFVKVYGSGNITDSTQFTTKYYVDNIAIGGTFLDSVNAMQVDNTLNPTLTLGTRYILLNTSSLHANFGTIAGVGNNDIVEYVGSAFTVVFDASLASLPATVTVGVDKNAATNHQWTYSLTEWVDRGALGNHNDMNGLNVGDYVHLTATEYTHFGTAYSHSQITDGTNPHATTPINVMLGRYLDSTGTLIGTYQPNSIVIRNNSTGSSGFPTSFGNHITFDSVTTDRIISLWHQKTDANSNIYTQTYTVAGVALGWNMQYDSANSNISTVDWTAKNGYFQGIGVGTGSPTSNYLIQATKDQNLSTRIGVANTTDNTGSFVSINLTTANSKELNIYAFSDLYATALRAGRHEINSTASNGLQIVSATLMLQNTYGTDIMKITGGIANFTSATTGVTATLSDNTTKYATTAFVKGQNYVTLTSFSTTATGLTYTNTTGVLRLTAGYVIPTTTDQTNWNNHIADNTQAHSDYLVNNANDVTSGSITAANFKLIPSTGTGTNIRYLGLYDFATGLTKQGAYGGLWIDGDLSYLYLGKEYNDLGIKLFPDAEVNLYYDNALKLATTSTGISVTGNVGLSGMLNITGTTKTAGYLYAGSTAPDGTTRLNYDGYFYATQLYDNGSRVLTSIAVATSTTIGGVKLFSDTAQSVAANSVSATASRTYGIQLNASNQAVVNIPWTDTTYSGGTPAIVLGTANTAGTSPNFLRRDDTILAFDTTLPASLGTAAVGVATVAARRDHVHTLPKLDDLAAPDANTDLNATTTAHGLLLAATAPASGLYNYVGITNGETSYSNKALFDATSPSTQAFGDAAVVGTAAVAARRDHKHVMPANPVSGTINEIAYFDSTSTVKSLAVATYPSLTELSYVKAVTGAIQTQLNGKAATIHNLIDTTNHPVSGLTIGHFLKATSATAYGFAAHGLTYSDVGAAASSHAHGNITNDGKIGSTSGLPVYTTTAGALTVGITQTPQALTQSGATLTMNISSGYNARVTLTADITTFTWSTAAVAGDSGVLTVIQNATGGWTLVLPSGHLKECGVLELSNAPNSKDVLGWYYDGTNYFWNIGKEFA